MSRLFQQSQQNLAAWLTLSMGSILVVFAAILHGLEIRDRLHSFDRDLESKARVMTAGVQYRLQQGRWRVKLENVPMLGSNTLPLSSDIAYARWYDSRGELMRFVKQKPTQLNVRQLGFETLSQQEHTQRFRQLTLPIRQNGQLIGYLQIAVPLSPLEQMLVQRQLLLTLGVPVALGIIALTGWRLGGIAMQPLQQSNDRLHRFTAHASHELRTPLAKVLGQAQLMLMEAPAQPRLEKIIQTTQGMSRLVKDLLFLARHDEDLNLEKLETVDLAEFLQELVWDVEGIAREKRITIHYDPPVQRVAIAADPDLIYQAVLNLIDNAVKYTPAEGWIQLQLRSEELWAIIQVKDSGIGIATEELPHLFERFYRVNSPSTPSIEGFGLGLAIAQQIVQVHGGKIEVTSSLGVGTCFQIRLPFPKT
jgi:two-component system, OmpR family, manganese sensing sensor histidine kinase